MLPFYYIHGVLKARILKWFAIPFSTGPRFVSREIKRHLLLERKTMRNLDSILKSRDNTLPTEVRLIKAMVSLVVIYDVRVGIQRKLSTKELMLLNCGAGEDS